MIRGIMKTLLLLTQAQNYTPSFILNNLYIDQWSIKFYFYIKNIDHT